MAASQSILIQTPGGPLSAANYGTATASQFNIPALDANNNLSIPGTLYQNTGGTGLSTPVYIPLVNFHATTGAALAVASATNAFYQQITAGTNAQIQSATTNAAQNTCGMIYDDSVPSTYATGTSNMTVVINCQRTLAGTASFSQVNLLVNYFPISITGTMLADCCNGTSVALAAGTLAQTVTFAVTNVGGTAGFVARQRSILKITGTFQEVATANGSILINSVSIQ